MIEIGSLEISYTVFWIAMVIIFGIIESMTMGLTSIWFFVGSLISLIVAMLGLGFTYQVVAFIITSVILLYFTRPIVVKRLKIGKTKTNIEAIIGEEGIVIEKIEPIMGKGQVKINGQIWSAKSEGIVIEKDERVKVLEIQGVKVIVKKLEED